MRSLVAGLAMLGTVVASQACAQTATYIVWQGQAVITSVTLPCSADPVGRKQITVGSTLLSVVRPRLLASNGNNSRISFTHNSQAHFAAVLAGGLTIAGPGTYTAYGVTHSALIRANVGGAYRNFSLSPAAPTATTPALALVGAIDNFMFIPGCTVAFRANYALRP